ncbi:MAG TPA: hypothetical protein VE172_24945 [Stackebrandtia sp.]|uniref:hypothetical protein n=1 Tax=Stackebrandtia sp. TaxID=2023065 RepID=UPI002D685A27|nr:hypothetical protein [Stackebrandtia sp.]HZE42057.1 hypothetical protein [Stackebrandtia sp.]
MLLVVVAVLLAVAGVVVWWMSTNHGGETGKYHASRVKNFCKSVDTKAFKKLTPKEDKRDATSDVKQDPAVFTCSVPMASGDGSTDYLTVTLNAEARVASDVDDATEIFTSQLDAEKAKGYKVSKSKQTGDAAATVMVAPHASPQVCRSHVRASNAVLSLTVLISGKGLSCESDAPKLLLDVSQSTLDVMGSE